MAISHLLLGLLINTCTINSNDVKGGSHVGGVRGLDVGGARGFAKQLF